MESLILRRGDGSHSIAIADWIKLMEIACEHGWQPTGTVATPEWDEPIGHLEDGRTYCLADMFLPWDGVYLDALGQIVTAPDARNLANALLAAIQDDPGLTVLLRDQGTRAILAGWQFRDRRMTQRASGCPMTL